MLLSDNGVAASDKERSVAVLLKIWVDKNQKFEGERAGAGRGVVLNTAKFVSTTDDATDRDQCSILPFLLSLINSLAL